MTRLEVMLKVRASHNEDYYKQAVRSKGVNEDELTHAEIAAFCAAVDAVEADIIIQMASETPVTNVTDIEINPKLLGRPPIPPPNPTPNI